MSEYMRNKGIIRRISTKDNVEEVYEKLKESGEIDGAYTEYRDGKLAYLESDKYQIIDGCIFDMSDAPAEYDSEEDLEEVEKLNDTDYRIHLYYYNGGTCDSEILDEKIPEADAKYSQYSDEELRRKLTSIIAPVSRNEASSLGHSYWQDAVEEVIQLFKESR